MSWALRTACLILILPALTAACSKQVDEYKLNSKLTGIREHLNRCYLGVVDYFDKPHARRDGALLSSVLPSSMAEPVCPVGRTVETLSGEAALFDPDVFGEDGKARALREVQLIIMEPAYACYQLTMDSPGKTPREGQTFTCHAWTDLDDDDQAAHWTKTGTYKKEVNSFQVGPVKRDPESDDW